MAANVKRGALRATPEKAQVGSTPEVGAPEQLPEAAPAAPQTPEPTVPVVRRPPVYYSPDLARRICDAIADGQALTRIAEGPGMPERTTIYHWLQDHPEFRSAFALARELSAYTLEEEAIAAVRKINLDPTFQTTQGVRAAEVLANQLRWSSAKRNANAFGDTQKASLVVPIQINTSLDLGQGGEARPAHDPAAVYRVQATLPTPEAVAERSPFEVMLEDSGPLTPKPPPKERPSKRTSFGPKGGRRKGSFKLTPEHQMKMAAGAAARFERLRAEKELREGLKAAGVEPKKGKKSA